MAIQARSPTFAPIRQWNSAAAVFAQDQAYSNLVLPALLAALPAIPVLRMPFYTPRRVWNSAEAIRAQDFIYPNLVGTNLFTPPIPRNFDYSVQPWNKLSPAAISALADNYTNIVINSAPSPIVRAVDLSVQPWNGKISGAAVQSWADNYSNRLASGFLVTPTPLPQRNYDYSVQPWNKLSAAAIMAWQDNYANRLVILPEPAPLPPINFDWPVYPPAIRTSRAAIMAWADNYVNRLASGFLPFVHGPVPPIARLPMPFTPIAIAPGGSGGPGLQMDRIWYRFFDSLARRVSILEDELAKK